jgi:hypothetical protein
VTAMAKEIKLFELLQTLHIQQLCRETEIVKT